MEVGVSFMEGDPDNPVVVCCMPNANTIPSIKLPDEKERTSFRTASSPAAARLQRIHHGRQGEFRRSVSPRAEGHDRWSATTTSSPSATCTRKATETLWLSTVHDSVIEQDAGPGILISHGRTARSISTPGRHPDQFRHRPRPDPERHRRARALAVQVDISQGRRRLPNFVSCAANGRARSKGRWWC